MSSRQQQKSVGDQNKCKEVSGVALLSLISPDTQETSAITAGEHTGSQ